MKARHAKRFSQNHGSEGHGRLSYWRKQLVRHKFVYLVGVVLPVLLFALFVGYPIVETVRLSFFRWDEIGTRMMWIGTQNYGVLLRDANFYLALANTAKWTGLTLLLPVLFGFLMAVFLTGGRAYLSGVIRSLFFFPMTMSLITIGIMFSLILNPVFGAFNSTVRAIGLGFLAHDWLGDPHSALYALILVFSWSYFGLPLTMFIAGINQIPAEFFEAAKLEGTRFLQTLLHVTMPMIRPVFTIVVVLSVVQSVRAFDLIFAMTRGGPFGQTTVLGYYMYTEAFLAYRYGYGASISVTLLVISSLFAIVYLRTIARGSLHASS